MTGLRLRRAPLFVCLLIVVACDAGAGTPWEQYGDRYETERIRSIVGDESQLINSFNAAYDEYESCGGAFDDGSEAERRFQEATDSIAASEGISPQEAYDRALGRFLAASEWLIQNECDERFISVG